VADDRVDRCPVASCSVCQPIEFGKAWDACTVQDGQAVGCGPHLVLRYAPPTVTTGGDFAGTFCNVDQWMGAAHDKMILFQQLLDEKKAPGVELTEQITQGAEQLDKFLQDIDLAAQIDNVLLGMCFQG
jgi:hypothetical protein